MCKKKLKSLVKSVICVKKKGMKLNLCVELSGVLNDGLKCVLVDVSKRTMLLCGEKYGFKCDDVLINVETRSVVMMVEKVVNSKVSFPLPFSGLKRDGGCHGLKQNHGLMSQCLNDVSKSLTDVTGSALRVAPVKYCSGCQKQCDKNGSGKPNSGCIDDRMTALNSGVEFRDPKGRAPTAYAKVMQKLNITEDQVLLEVAKFNIVFNRENFAMPESKRGRPKKEGTTSVENMDTKKRGRPKKALKAVEVSSTEDLFATLISEVKAGSSRPALVKETEKAAAKALKEQAKLDAKAVKNAEKQAKKGNKKEAVIVQVPVVVAVAVPVVVEEEEEEEVSVKKFDFNGVTYLRTKDNVLYDAVTQDCIGCLLYTSPSPRD